MGSHTYNRSSNRHRSYTRSVDKRNGKRTKKSRRRSYSRTPCTRSCSRSRSRSRSRQRSRPRHRSRYRSSSNSKSYSCTSSIPQQYRLPSSIKARSPRSSSSSSSSSPSKRRSPKRSRYFSRSHSRSRSHSKSYSCTSSMPPQHRNQSKCGKLRSPLPPSSSKPGSRKYSNNRSYSRSITPRYNNYDHGRHSRKKYRNNSRSSTSCSRSPSPRRNPSSERHRIVSRERPPPSRCLGVFGLSVSTTQQKIREIFSKFGPIERIQVVIDAQTGHSRGFCFIYFENLADATRARYYCSGLEIDRRRVRVDYSITERPHTPTPGVYKGRATRTLREKYRKRGRGRSPSSPPSMHSTPSDSHRRRHHRDERSSSNCISPRHSRH